MVLGEVLGGGDLGGAAQAWALSLFLTFGILSVPAEFAEHQRQLQQQKKRVEELEQELREAKASAAKLKALNNSDQEQGVAQQQFIDQVQAQLDSEK